MNGPTLRSLALCASVGLEDGCMPFTAPLQWICSLPVDACETELVPLRDLVPHGKKLQMLGQKALLALQCNLYALFKKPLTGFIMHLQPPFRARSRLQLMNH